MKVMKLESYSVDLKMCHQMVYINIVSLNYITGFLSAGVCIFLPLYPSSHLAQCLALFNCNEAL